MRKRPSYKKEDIDKIINWMKNISDFYGYHKWTKDDLITYILGFEHKDGGEWSTGGFRFKKTKKGLYILPEPKGKVLVKNSWRKKHPSNKRKPNEIQEHRGHTYKCPMCEKYVCNNNRCECGYKRPTDKLIIELWNQRKTLKEIKILLDEPNPTYIKSRLRKYDLFEPVGYINEREATDGVVNSVIVWENVNEDRFPNLEDR